MLASDSQELPSEGNDNEFLPNHSNSYESMIQEHQQRRSLILNDQLLRPNGTNSHREGHIYEQGQEEEMGGMLGGESGLQSRGRQEGSMAEQQQENEFMMNENSLAASIKQAIHNQQSQMPSRSGQQSHFQQPVHSQMPSFPMDSNMQHPQNSHFGEQSSHSLLNSRQLPPHSGNSALMDSNIESKKQHSSGIHHQMEGEVSRNSQESDPFQNVNHQDEQNGQEEDPFSPSSAVEDHQDAQQSNGESQHEQQQSHGQQHMMFKQPNEHSQSFQRQKSRSQIQALHSDLDSKSGPYPQHSSQLMPSNPSQDIPSQGIPSQGIPSQAIHSQAIPSQHQQGSKEQSLSNLMRYNYFEKAYHQFSQKVESEEMLPSEDVFQSDVKVFRQEGHEEQLGNMSQQSRAGERKEESRSPSQIDHILMTYESNSNIKSNSHPQSQQPSIINNINDISQNSNAPERSHLPSGQPSSDHQSILASNNERMSLQQLQSIAREHKQQINEFDMNRSRITSNQQHSQHSQQEYFNQFNQQEQEQHPFQEQSRQGVQSRQRTQSKRESHQGRMESEYHEQGPYQFQQGSRRSDNSSKMRMQSNISMPIIDSSKRDNPSKLAQYQLQSSKSHKKQHSVIERSSKNASSLHLPEIDTKKRPSQISKRSNATKKSPSIHVDNQSKISLTNSKPNIYSKKSSIRLDRNTRDKMVSYSEGVHVESGEERSQAYRDTLIGETTLDSKSIIMKKKEASAKEIFNTVPEDINLITSEHACPHPHPNQNEKEQACIKPVTIMQKAAKQKDPPPVRSPNKERQQQLQRIRVLKQAQRKRLQRELQKVKKELEEINTREKDMDRIFDEKQKIEMKERERLVNSREGDFTNKLTRHHRENEALLNIIKQHRKSKELGEQGGENYEESINKNLLQLNQIRREAEQKQREKKRLQILDRMKKNEMRKLNEQKLVKANNQYIQQFRSVDNPVLSPQAHLQHPHPLSKDKGLPPSKKGNKDTPHMHKLSQFVMQDRRRMGSNAYEQKLD